MTLPIHKGPATRLAPTLNRTTACLVVAALLPAWALAQPLMQAEGAEVTPDDIRAVAQRMAEPSRFATLSKEGNVQRLAEEILLRRLLAQQAEKAALDQDVVVQAQLRQARERVLSDARLAAIEAAAHPGAEALARYASDLYRGDPGKYQGPEQWRASHILFMPSQGGNPRERAQRVQDELRKGIAFEQLARHHSDDKGSAPLGGDLGWFGKGAMVKEFQAALEALKNPGEVSGLVETSFGVHLIKLEGHRKAGQRTFEEVREDIEKGVLNQRQSDARQAAVKEALKTATTNPTAIQAAAKAYAKP